jgi:cytochrome c peroxidase
MPDALGQDDPARAAIAAMKRNYQRPPPRAIENQALVDLGRDLFFDAMISASGKTACATCHFPELAWVVTDAKSRNDSGKLTSRKSQPLIGLGHARTIRFGWDGRNATLEEQAKNSIATGSMSMRETDTPVKVDVIEERVRANADYVAKFKAALPQVAIGIDSVVQAIAAFERTIEPGTAPDRR